MHKGAYSTSTFWENITNELTSTKEAGKINDFVFQGEIEHFEERFSNSFNLNNYEKKRHLRAIRKSLLSIFNSKANHPNLKITLDDFHTTEVLFKKKLVEIKKTKNAIIKSDLPKFLQNMALEDSKIWDVVDIEDKKERTKFLTGINYLKQKSSQKFSSPNTTPTNLKLIETIIKSRYVSRRTKHCIWMFLSQADFPMSQNQKKLEKIFEKEVCKYDQYPGWDSLIDLAKQEANAELQALIKIYLFVSSDYRIVKYLNEDRDIEKQILLLRSNQALFNLTFKIYEEIFPVRQQVTTVDSAQTLSKEIKNRLYSSYNKYLE